jgi:hypothetical protein
MPIQVQYKNRYSREPGATDRMSRSRCSKTHNRLRDRQIEKERSFGKNYLQMGFFLLFFCAKSAQMDKVSRGIYI